MAFLPPSSNDVANLLALAEVMTDAKKLKEAVASIKEQTDQMLAARDDATMKLAEAQKLNAEVDKRVAAVSDAEKAVALQVEKQAERKAQLDEIEASIAKQKQEILTEQNILKARESAVEKRENGIAAKAEINAARADELEQKAEEVEALRVSYEQKIAALKALAG
jgi:colicin import membrane protein